MKLKTKFIPKKLIFLFVLLSLLAAGCGGGGGSAPKQVILNVWMTFEDSENLQPLLQAYQQKHPNVQVAYTKKSVDTYQSDLLNALAAGTGPDVFAIHNDWLPQYLDKVSPAPEGVFS